MSMTPAAAQETILSHLEAIRGHLTTINAHLGFIPPVNGPNSPAVPEHLNGLYHGLGRPFPPKSVLGSMFEHMAGEFCGHPSIGGGTYVVR